MLARVAAVAALVAIVALIVFQLGKPTNDVANLPSPAGSASAEPSEEPSAEPYARAPLVLRLMGAGEAGPVHVVTILEDGRVITTDPGGVNQPMVRRLTTAGVQLVRDELAATGVPTSSARYYPVERPGANPPGYGGAGPSLEIGLSGGGVASIGWYLFNEPPERDDYLPQPEAEALEAVAARLSTPEAWLPASAWIDAAGVAYEPETYQMHIAYSPWGGRLDDLPVEIEAVTWPLDIGAFGEVSNPGPDEVRCGYVDARDGGAVIDALEVAGARQEEYLVFWLGDRANTRLVIVTLHPILPLAEATC